MTLGTADTSRLRENWPHWTSALPSGVSLAFQTPSSCVSRKTLEMSASGLGAGSGSQGKAVLPQEEAPAFLESQSAHWSGGSRARERRSVLPPSQPRGVRKQGSAPDVDVMFPRKKSTESDQVPTVGQNRLKYFKSNR